MEYISLSWYNIPELVVPIRFAANKEATEPRVPLSWNHHFECFTVATMTWLTVMEYLCHNGHGYVPFVVNTSRSYPRSWLITGYVTRLTRLVEQELLSLLEHLSSPPVFNGVRVTRSLGFIYMFCWSLFVLLYFLAHLSEGNVHWGKADD